MRSATPDLDVVADHVEVRSPSEYAMRGRSRGVRAGGPALLQELQQAIYADLYCRTPEGTGMAIHDLRASDGFTAALSRANGGGGTWESGWTLLGDEDGRRVVRKDDLTLWVTSEQFRADGPSRGRVRMAKEIRGLMPGFYFALGDGSDDAPPEDPREPVVRLYWHLRPEGAATLVGEATSVLNPLRVPFRLKLLTDPRAYVRADAAVLYVARSRYLAALGACAEIHRRVKRQLRPEVPLFTKRLAPGLGLAEDPGNGESFGQHRCRVAALGLWRAFEKGRTSRSQRLLEIADAFRETRLRPELPHLNPGSKEDYPCRPYGNAGGRKRKVAAKARS